jgi:hypothetical protein
MPPYSARGVLTSLFGRAAAMFTKASSMDDIVDMAHMLIRPGRRPALAAIELDYVHFVLL